ncbi:MAG: CDP-alcohol phosphatidyltransferase family protein [Clostridia bacterium]|nr:CDP-alcohol phosphatidyltransferase family protein [Clostridia bacterium]
MSEGKNSSSLNKEIFTVPNILVYIRVLLIPVFVYIYIHADCDKDYYMALAVMVVAFLTDFFDGKIARRFNLVTDLGKVLDPIADKLYQFSVALCLMFEFPKMLLIAVLLFVKEMIMGLMGLILLNKGGKVFGAKWYGKICTGVVDLSMVFLFFTPLLFDGNVPEALCDFLVYLCAVFLIITSFLYTRYFYLRIKEAEMLNKN